MRINTAHPLQRAWRDIHFMSRPEAITEPNFAHFGQMELGVGRPA